MLILEANAAPVPFNGKGGWAGTLQPAPLHGDEAEATLQLLARPDDGGSPLIVPAELVVRRGDGTYFLPLGRDEAQAASAEGEARVIPLVEETLVVEKRMVETGTVRVTKTVRETTETVEQTLLREAVQVNRVPVNRIVDAPEAARKNENGTLIIPIYEETLVVEKRLVLKEELHITIAQTVETSAQTVTLRHEDARIERIPAPLKSDDRPA